MKPFRKALPAVAGLLFVGVMVGSGISPASAQVPFTSSQGTALVGGTPLVRANCPSVAAVSSGPATTSTLGTTTVTGAGAECGGGSASTSGEYAITGATPPPGTSTLRFNAACTQLGDTNGFIDVPPGSTVNGGAPVLVQTIVTTPNAAVVFPGGTTGTANVTTTTPTSVTRSALTLSNGTVIGRVVCGGTPYPLAVGGPGVGAPAPDVALTAVSGDGGGSSANRALYVGGAIALLVLAQVAFGRTVWRRRHDAAGS